MWESGLIVSQGAMKCLTQEKVPEGQIFCLFKAILWAITCSFFVSFNYTIITFTSDGFKIRLIMKIVCSNPSSGSQFLPDLNLNPYKDSEGPGPGHL